MLPNGYGIIRQDMMSGKGGGVAIICKEHLKCKKNENVDISSFEALSVICQINDNCTHRCHVIYRPPGYDPQFFQQCSDFCHLITMESPNTIILGDINLNWANSIDKEVESVKRLCDNLGFSHMVPQPTHEAGRILDFLFSQEIRGICENSIRVG